MPLYYELLYIIYLNTHLFLCPPIVRPFSYPFSYPRKKNNYFLSTSHLVYPFQKSVVLTSASVYYVDNTCNYQKKEKIQCQRCGLTCNSDNKTDELCHHRRNVGKKLV